MARWEESSRLLMLAADVPALLHDPDGARQVLEQARPEEIQAPEAAEVLGDAALRADAEDLALRFTENVASTDAVLRIKASANLDNPAHRLEAVRQLRELALGGGPEAEHAAVERLGACLHRIPAPWDEEVAAVLAGGPHERAVTGLRIMTLASTKDILRAERLAAQLPNESWAAELRLRVALERGNHEILESTATEFLTFGPDAAGRLLAGKGLALADRKERASEIFGSVAHDINAPPRVRADAFEALMRTLAARDRWDHAAREWERWQELSVSSLDRPDPRVSAWQARVAHRMSRRPSEE